MNSGLAYHIFITLSHQFQKSKSVLLFFQKFNVTIHLFWIYATHNICFIAYPLQSQSFANLIKAKQIIFPLIFMKTLVCLEILL